MIGSIESSVRFNTRIFLFLICKFCREITVFCKFVNCLYFKKLVHRVSYLVDIRTIFFVLPGLLHEVMIPIDERNAKMQTSVKSTRLAGLRWVYYRSIHSRLEIQMLLIALRKYLGDTASLSLNTEQFLFDNKFYVLWGMAIYKITSLLSGILSFLPGCIPQILYSEDFVSQWNCTVTLIKNLAHCSEFWF